MTAALKDAKAITSETDDLGALARFTIDTLVYSKTAIFKTTYWFTDRCYIFLSRVDNRPSTIDIEVRPKSVTSREDLIVLCREFCNSLIDQQVRQDVIAETGPIRDNLLKKAFFEGRDHLPPDTLRSEEKHIPQPNQSYASDPLKISRPTGR